MLAGPWSQDWEARFPRGHCHLLLSTGLSMLRNERMEWTRDYRCDWSDWGNVTGLHSFFLLLCQALGLNHSRGFCYIIQSLWALVMTRSSVLFRHQTANMGTPLLVTRGVFFLVYPCWRVVVTTQNTGLFWVRWQALMIMIKGVTKGDSGWWSSNIVSCKKQMR